MLRVVNEIEEIRVPYGLTDLGFFRRWTEADDFPEKANIGYLRGVVWVDLSKEQVFSHVLVKTCYTSTLGTLVDVEKSGLYLTHGVFLNNVDADLSTKPDGTYITNESIMGKRIRFVEGMREDTSELEGSPDMVLEVVSRSSVWKDTVELRRAYWEAGIREYWLVDARYDPPSFDILRHTVRGFTATRKRDRWLKSEVFGKSFRLVRTVTALGHPEFTLEVR